MHLIVSPQLYLHLLKENDDDDIPFESLYQLLVASDDELANVGIQAYINHYSTPQNHTDNELRKPIVQKIVKQMVGDRKFEALARFSVALDITEQLFGKTVTPRLERDYTYITKILGASPSPNVFKISATYGLKYLCFRVQEQSNIGLVWDLLPKHIPQIYVLMNNPNFDADSIIRTLSDIRKYTNQCDNLHIDIQTPTFNPDLLSILFESYRFFNNINAIYTTDTSLTIHITEPQDAYIGLYKETELNDIKRLAKYFKSKTTEFHVINSESHNIVDSLLNLSSMGDLNNLLKNI